MKTAFVVLTFNRPDALLSVLRSLARQCDARHEIVIADDGSTPDTLNVLLSELPKFSCQVRYVWHPDVGFTASHARNMGAAVSSADYLVFLDGDCIPNRHFVEAHNALMSPGFFVNGNRVLLSEKLTKNILLNSGSIEQAHWTKWLLWRLKGDVNKITHLFNVPHAPFRGQAKFRWKRIRSCNFGVWRKDFLKVNGFDESFEGWGHEDADLVLRLHNAGVGRRNGFLATEVYHLWHREFSRTSEMDNRDRVSKRVESGLVIAAKGIAETINAPDFSIKELN